MAAVSYNHAVDRYLARSFLAAFLVVLIVVVTLLQSLDLMNEAEEILAAEGSDVSDILRYISLRAPQLADRFAPFVALLAALIVFTRLGQHSEIVALRAAGISPLRVVAPVCAVGGLIALAHFTLHELVVVDASSRLEQWRSAGYAPGLETVDASVFDLRVSDGERIVRADVLAQRGGVWRLENLRAYDLGPRGIVAALRAETALHDGEGWRVENARRFDDDTQRWSEAGPDVWRSGPHPGQLAAAALDPERTGVLALGRAAGAASGMTTAARLETAFLHRFAAPMASILMPLLGAIAGFGLTRSRTLLARIAAGLALGFAYFVFDNFMVVMGRLDALPALLAAFATPAMFLAIALSIRR